MRKLTDDELQFIIGRVMTYALEALDTIRNELLARDCDLKFFGLDCSLERVLSPRK